MSETIIKGVKNKLKMYQHVPGLMLERYEICSLINTIESLQESFDRQVEGHKYTATEYANERAAHNLHVTELLEKEKIIESQKEEIEAVTREREFARRKAEEAWKEDDEKHSLIESLKAITELAVKGLKEIACLNVDSDYSAGTIARNTLSEIERIKSEQT